jgi:catechol 2,3-dioxygenase-like lactoylglutathione lyase family enzyme
VLARTFLAAAVLALSIAPAASAAQVEAGVLGARVTERPWSLVFTDGHGRHLLSESPGTGSGPTGRLGFKTALGWFHATHVIASRAAGATAYEATLATNDPLGRRIELRLARDAGGVIAMTARVTGRAVTGVTHTGIAFRPTAGERYLGFGERSNAVEQRRREVESYALIGAERCRSHGR